MCILVLIVVVAVQTDGAPMNPMMALSVGGTAVSNFGKGWAGVSNFISNVRSFFGKAGEFASRNGFDYGHVYNAILEYNILQTYETSELKNIVLQMHHSMEKSTMDLDKIYIVLVALLAVAIINALLSVLFYKNEMSKNTNNNNNNNVNVVHTQ